MLRALLWRSASHCVVGSQSALPSFGVMSDWMKLVVASISSRVKIFFDDEILRCREKMYNFAD